MHDMLRTIEFSWSPYIEKWNCLNGIAIVSQQHDQEETDLGDGGNC